MSARAGALALADVLQRADVWRGDSLAVQPEAGVSTGYALLDAELPGGGWPRGQLTELLPVVNGIGELALLQPALAQLSAAGGWLAVIAPPWKLHAPAWLNSGVSLSRLAIVDAGKESAWCCEQLLAGGAFAAVLAWLDSRVDARVLRRLQAAGEGKRTLAFLWRPPLVAATPSPAALRLQLASAPLGLNVRLLKRRGRPALEHLHIPIHRPGTKAYALAGTPFSSLTARSAEHRVYA